MHQNKLVTIGDDIVTVVNMRQTSTAYWSGTAIFDRKPIATIDFTLDGLPVAKTIARAAVSIRSYRASDGKWSCYGEEDEQPFPDLPSALVYAGRARTLTAFGLPITHWCLEQEVGGKYARFLIWDGDTAAAVKFVLSQQILACGRRLSFEREQELRHFKRQWEAGIRQFPAWARPEAFALIA
jgi:hypothetical protein